MTLKLRDDTLAKSIKNDGLKQMYLVAGNEPYTISRCVARISEAVGGDVERLDFCTSSDEDVEQLLSSYGFTEKLVVIDNFKASEYTDGKRELYSGLLDDLPYGVYVVVKAVSDGPYFKLSKGAEGFASLCPDGAIVICEKKQKDDLVKYVCNMARNAGASMNYECARELIGRRGDDLFLLSNETRKLAAACGYGEITVETVRRMCPKTTDDSVFDFVRAVEKGDSRQAIALFYEIMEQEQVPNAVIAAISSSYINLSRVNAARSSGISREQLESDFAYKKGDRALAVAYDKGGRFSVSKLDEIIELLYDINVRLTSSAEDKQTVMERGMVMLANIMNGGMK